MFVKLTRLLLIILSLALGCVTVSAQDSYSTLGFGESSLGDAARAARAKHEQSAKASFTLTNDDLRRERIVASVTEAAAGNPTNRLDAKKVSIGIAPIPVPTLAKVERERILNQPTPKSVDEKSTFSLGEYAKAVREQKIEHAALEQSAHQILTTPEKDVVAVVTIPVRTTVPQARSAAGDSLGEIARLARAEQAKNPAVPKREITVPLDSAEPVNAGLNWKAIPVGAAPVVLVAGKVRQAIQTPQAITSNPGTTASIRVKSGDSLWKLSQQHFGDGRLWTALWKANPKLKNPNVVVIGQLLRNPSASQLAMARPRSTENSLVLASLAKHAQRPMVALAMSGKNTTVQSATGFASIAQHDETSIADVAWLRRFED